jgi:hypothetical protein
LIRSECRALTHGTVLNRNGEERGAVNFFPKIKAGIVPNASNVIEVNLDLRPDGACRVRSVALRDEVVRLSKTKLQELFCMKC